MATGSYLTPIYSRSQILFSGDFFPLPTTYGPTVTKTGNRKSYTRAFGNGPRNFEPWLMTWMTPELAPLSPNYHTTPT
ncbi:hypothetical protein TNCV_4501081 [Trichonephila clavipes]|nr:hypothetical protein TNCV_4501081 [Trichonephila clavipes]